MTSRQLSDPGVVAVSLCDPAIGAGVIGSERVRERVEESPEGRHIPVVLNFALYFGGSFDSALRAPLRMTGLSTASVIPSVGTPLGVWRCSEGQL